MEGLPKATPIILVSDEEEGISLWTRDNGKNGRRGKFTGLEAGREKKGREARGE